MRYWLLLGLSLYLCLPDGVSAAIPYEKLYPDPVASHRQGVVNIQQGVTFIGGDTSLHFQHVNDQQGKGACEGGRCVANRQQTPSIKIPAMPPFRSNDNIVYAGDNRRNLHLPAEINHLSIKRATDRNTRGSIRPRQYVTHIRQLHLEAGRQVGIQPGVYFIDTLIVDGTFTVGNREPVLIIANNIRFGVGGRFNPGHEDPYVVGLIAHNSITLQGKNTINAWLYANSSIDIGEHALLRGGANAPNINIAKNARVWRKDVYMKELIDFDTFAYLNSAPTLAGYWDSNYREDAEEDNFRHRDQAFDMINANHASLLGGTVLTNNGKFCEGLYFNGKGAYAHVPDHKDYRGANNTIAFWAKADDLNHSHKRRWQGRTQFLFSKESKDFDNGGHLSTWLANDGSIGIRYQTSNKDYYLYTDDKIVQPGQWFHYALSLEDKRMVLYINGEAVAHNNDSGGSQQYNHEPIVLGAGAVWSEDKRSTANHLNDFFKGTIDEFRWYAQALTAAEVKELVLLKPACEPRPSGGLIAEYRFADTSDDANWQTSGAVKDSSGNDHHAKISGEPRLMTPVNNMSCGVLDVPPNTNQRTPDFLDTPVKLHRDVGSAGTISFWFKSNSGWRDERDRTLLDAVYLVGNNVRDGNNKFFYVSLREAGYLEIGMEDSNDRNFIQRTKETFATPEHTWVHVAIAYDFAKQRQHVFLNGKEQALTTIQAPSSWTGQMPEYGQLAIGDNRTDYYAPTLSANGRFDDVRIYRGVQTAEQISADMQTIEPCSVIAGYLLEHDDQAMTCEATEMTLKACRDSDCKTLHDEEVQVSLQFTAKQTPPPAQTLTFTGKTSISLSHQTAQTVTIEIQPLYHALPDELDKRCSNDCEISFADAGLQIYSGERPPAFADSDVGPKVTSRFSADAGKPLKQFSVRAVHNNQGVCEALVSGSQRVNVTYSCYQQLDRQTTLGCAAPLVNELKGPGAQRTQTTLEFDKQGRAPLTPLQMNDAVNVIMNLAITNSALSALNIGSNTVDIAFQPTDLRLSANFAGPPVAGEPFGLSLSAVGANGITLPSYQFEQLILNAEQIRPNNGKAHGQLTIVPGLTVNTLPKLGAAIGKLTNNIRSALTFTKGLLSIEDVRYDDTGTISLTMTDQRKDKDLVSNTLTLGAFVPAYFSVSHTHTPSTTDAHANFTYLGQPFGFALGIEPELTKVARNGLGQAVNNYHGDDWLLRPSAAAVMAETTLIDHSGASAALSISDAPVAPQLANIDTADGSGTLTLGHVQFNYTKPTTPLLPFASDMSLTLSADFLTDPNGVCYQTNYPAGGCESYTFDNITGTQLRYGRLNLVNAFGPEHGAIRVPLHAEYFATAGWVLNRDDDSTLINLNQALGQVELSLRPESEHDVLSGMSGVDSSGFLLAGQSDAFDLVLSAPNQKSALDVSLHPGIGNPVWAEYLNIDWNGDGVIDDTDRPSASVHFGLYRGNDRRINYREVMP